MSGTDQPPIHKDGDPAADVAQTYRDLAKGEQAAAAMEANLTNLESKLDAMLAALEAKEAATKPAENRSNGQ